MTGVGESRHQQLKKNIRNMKRFEAIKYLQSKGYTCLAASRACNEAGFRLGDCKASSNN